MTELLDFDAKVDLLDMIKLVKGLKKNNIFMKKLQVGYNKDGKLRLINIWDVTKDKNIMDNFIKS